MAFTNAQPFPYIMTPISQVTPFTYTDGGTYLSQLEQMRSWLNEELVPAFNAGIDNAIAEYQKGLGNAEAYVDEMISYINNKTGDVEVQRYTLPYTLTIDPQWPTNHPVNVTVKQDANGGEALTIGPNIAGTVALNTTGNSVTEFQLVPLGDGTWKIVQFSALFADLWAALQGIETDLAALGDTSADHTTTLAAHATSLTNIVNAATALDGRVDTAETDIDALQLDAKLLTAPNGDKFRLGVTNGGSLTLTAI